MDNPFAPKQHQPPIKVPGFAMHFNEQLKIAILYDADSTMPNDRYYDLEQHLKARGWILQVIVGTGGNVFDEALEEQYARR